MEKKTITEINDEVVRAVAKKLINSTNSNNMPFADISFHISKAGYGFIIRTSKKDLLSVRNGKTLFVNINNTTSYSQRFLISDISMDKLTTESAVESYKKYCINTIYSLYKKWLESVNEKEPKLGNYYLYKF